MGDKVKAGVVLYLPLVVFIGAVVITMIEFGVMIYSMACMDCTFRGSGAGGRY